MFAYTVYLLNIFNLFWFNGENRSVSWLKYMLVRYIDSLLKFYVKKVRYCPLMFIALVLKAK